LIQGDHDFLIFQYLIELVLPKGIRFSCMVRLLVQNKTLGKEAVIHLPGSNLNIALNKRISSIDSMQELCELIHASSTQFNHVNVATAFRRVLQMPRLGVSQDTVAKALRALTALQNMHDFGSKVLQHSTIMAKQRHYEPIENLLWPWSVGRRRYQGSSTHRCCKHAVGVCDNGEKAGGADDGSGGGAGGGDIRGVQLAGSCKHAVVNVFFFARFPLICTAVFSSLVLGASLLDLGRV
jgi:hypothetical protein